MSPLMMGRLNSLLLTLTTLVSIAHSAVMPLSPGGEGVVFKTGDTCQIVYSADTTGTWKQMNVGLYSGSNTEMTLVTTVASGVDGTVGGERVTAEWQCPEVYPNAPIYFYVFTNGNEFAYTSRFTIAAADGSQVPAENANQPDGSAIPWGVGALGSGPAPQAQTTTQQNQAWSASEQQTTTTTTPAQNEQWGAAPSAGQPTTTTATQAWRAPEGAPSAATITSTVTSQHQNWWNGEQQQSESSTSDVELAPSPDAGSASWNNWFTGGNSQGSESESDAPGMSLLPTSMTSTLKTKTCSATSKCGAESPCCSETGKCGAGRSCLAGCDPLGSFSPQACLPIAICATTSYKWDANAATKFFPNGQEWNGTATGLDYIFDSLGHNPGFFPFTDSGAVLTVTETGGTQLSSTRSILYGEITVRAKAAGQKGLLSSIALQSGTGDEIAFVFAPGSLTSVYTSYFWKGDTFDFDTAEAADVGYDWSQEFHDYKITWTEDGIKWSIDGKEIRMVQKISTKDKDNAQLFRYPNTPSRLRVSFWVGGASDSSTETLEFTGGPVDFSDPAFAKNAHFQTVIEGASISCNDPAALQFVSRASSQANSQQVESAPGQAVSAPAGGNWYGETSPTATWKRKTRRVITLVKRQAEQAISYIYGITSNGDLQLAKSDADTIISSPSDTGLTVGSQSGQRQQPTQAQAQTEGQSQQTGAVNDGQWRSDTTGSSEQSQEGQEGHSTEGNNGQWQPDAASQGNDGQWKPNTPAATPAPEGKPGHKGEEDAGLNSQTGEHGPETAFDTLDQGTQIGIIVGAVLGGLVLLGAIIFLIVRIRRNKAANEHAYAQVSGGETVPNAASYYPAGDQHYDGHMSEVGGSSAQQYPGGYVKSSRPK